MQKYELLLRDLNPAVTFYEHPNYLTFRDALIKRFKNWQSAGLPNCDPGFRKFFETWDDNHPLIPVWNCTGHIGDKPTDNKGYLCFFAERGDYLFWHDLLMTRLQQESYVAYEFCMDLDDVNLGWIFDVIPFDTEVLRSMEYPVITIRWAIKESNDELTIVNLIRPLLA